MVRRKKSTASLAKVGNFERMIRDGTCGDVDTPGNAGEIGPTSEEGHF